MSDFFFLQITIILEVFGNYKEYEKKFEYLIKPLSLLRKYYKNLFYTKKMPIELKKKNLEKKNIRKWGMIFQYMNNINIII